MLGVSDFAQTDSMLILAPLMFILCGGRFTSSSEFARSDGVVVTRQTKHPAKTPVQPHGSSHFEFERTSEQLVIYGNLKRTGNLPKSDCFKRGVSFRSQLRERIVEPTNLLMRD